MLFDLNLSKETPTLNGVVLYEECFDIINSILIDLTNC